MWMMTTYGFFSVACARQGNGAHSQPVDPDRLMIRARVRSHLESLQERFPELNTIDIFKSPSADYPFRIFVEKNIWTHIAAELTREISYDNFKSEVGQGQSCDGEGYLHALHKVWSVMRGLECSWGDTDDGRNNS